jgi:hypothetical protein
MQNSREDFQGLAGTSGDQPGDYDMPTNPQTPYWWAGDLEQDYVVNDRGQVIDNAGNFAYAPPMTGDLELDFFVDDRGQIVDSAGNRPPPPNGNLELDFMIDERGRVVDSAGNRGQFVDGDWMVQPTPQGYSPTVSTVTQPAAPTPAPTALPAAPSATRRSSGSKDMAGLMALLGAGGQQAAPAAPYETANVAPGVQAGLEAIKQMYGGR